MILASGTYFSLDRPVLQQLRRLIEEARSLQESSRDSLGLSRYQVDLCGGALRGRRRGRPGGQLAAGGRSAGRGRGCRASCGAARRAGDAAPLPAGRARLAGVPARERPRRDPRRRHGPREDRADPRAVPARARARRRRPFLVVAPTSVVENWAREAARFAPGLESARSARPRPAGHEPGRRDRGRRPRRHVVHAVPPRVRGLRRRDVGRRCCSTRPSSSRTTRARPTSACAASTSPPRSPSPAPRSRTRLMDLWSLLSITAPGLYPDPKRFSEHVPQADRERRRPSCSPPSDGASARSCAAARRTRSLTELPPKTEQIVEVELSPRHARIYETPAATTAAEGARPGRRRPEAPLRDLHSR